MTHFSLSSLQHEIAAQAALAYQAGVRFFVACENQRGEWFALHADDQDHAARLARHWVEVLNCRGASCWRLLPDGYAPRPFFTYFEDPSDGSEWYGEDAIEGEKVAQRLLT